MKRTFALLVVLVSIVATAPAQATDVPATIRVSLETARGFPAKGFPNGRLIVRTARFEAGADERRIITGRLTGLNREYVARLQQVMMLCDRVGTPASPSRVLSTKNHPGPAASRGSGEVSIDVRYLFVAHAPGSFRCELWARGTGDRMVAVPARTYIEMSAGNQSLAQQWSGPPCDSNGAPAPVHPVWWSACRYVVPGAQGGFRQTEADIVNDLLLASRDAKAVEVFGDVQLTSCYQRTGQCIPQASRYGGRAPYSKAVVATRLEVYQLDHLGGICSKTFDPPRGKTKVTIPARTHHLKVHHRLVHRLDPACGRRLVARVIVTALDGDPVKIDELINYDQNIKTADGLSGRAYSNGILRNIF